MVRDINDRGRSGLLGQFGIILVAAAAFVALVVLVSAALFSPAHDVVIVKAQAGPFKTKPEEPGGTRILHQNTTVMGMLDDATGDGETAEILAPPQGGPEPGPQPLLTNSSNRLASRGDAARTLVPSGSGAATVSHQPSRSRAAAGPAPTAEIKRNPTPVPQPVPRGRSNAQSDDAVDEPLFLVQLAAYRTERTAREQAGLLGAAHISRLNGLRLGVARIKGGNLDGGWRVVTHPVSHKRAEAICAAMKQAGQGCFIRAFETP